MRIIPRRSRSKRFFVSLEALLFITLSSITLSTSLHAQNWNWDRDNRDRGDYQRDWRNDRGWRRQYERNPEGSQDVTENQKRACSPEVFRLCSRYIPDRDAITACLHNNIANLNPGCRAVMEGRLR